MGKRSDFPRVERDFYPTPESAVRPLLPHLEPGTQFCEPCAGDGRLIDHLEAAGHRCIAAFDIEPKRDGILHDNAKALTVGGNWWKSDGLPEEFDCFITNPPWDRGQLHGIIENLSGQRPTWLLFDADWVHTRQSGGFVHRLRKIVSVGRVKWIEDSPFTGKDNCAWHLFDARSDAPAVFVGRMAA